MTDVKFNSVTLQYLKPFNCANKWVLARLKMFFCDRNTRNLLTLCK